MCWPATPAPQTRCGPGRPCAPGGMRGRATTAPGHSSRDDGVGSVTGGSERPRAGEEGHPRADLPIKYIIYLFSDVSS